MRNLAVSAFSIMMNDRWLGVHHIQTATVAPDLKVTLVRTDGTPSVTTSRTLISERARRDIHTNSVAVVLGHLDPMRIIPLSVHPQRGNPIPRRPRSPSQCPVTGGAQRRISASKSRFDFFTFRRHQRYVAPCIVLQSRSRIQ